MTSPLHEAVTKLLRDEPRLLVDLLGSAVDLPKHEAVRSEAAELGAPVARELRADALVVLRRRKKPVFAAVAEVQGAIDLEKLLVWAGYLVGACLRYRCPAIVVVIALDAKVAAWARQRVEFGPGAGYFQALVLGPEQIPAITDLALARADLPLAVLSALVHARDADAERAAEVAGAATVAALEQPGDDALMYYDVIRSALSAAAKERFEMMLQDYQFQDEGLRRALKKGKAEGRAEGKAEGRAEGRAEGKAEGRAEGKAEGILAVLEARGLAVTASQRASVLACRDVAQLDAWLRGAVTAASTAALLAPRAPAKRREGAGAARVARARGGATRAKR